MFLDEELKEIYDRYDPILDEESAVNCAIDLLNKCGDRLVIKRISPRERMEFGTRVKQVDASWRLFCRTCKPIFKDDLFRRHFWNSNKDDAKESCIKLFKQLKWDIPNE